MGRLMRIKIIPLGLRNKHRVPMNADMTAAAAASPACALVSYGYTPIGDTDERREVSHTSGNVGAGFIGKLLNLIV